MGIAESQTGEETNMSIDLQSKNMRQAVIASIIGSTLEYYDFALYGMASAIILKTLLSEPRAGGRNRRKLRCT